MTVKDRTRLAFRVSEHFARRFGAGIAFTLLDGSTARGDATEASDLEVRLVTTPDFTIRTHGPCIWRCVEEEIVVIVEAVQHRTVVRTITAPASEWPVRVWPFLEPTVLSRVAANSDDLLKEYCGAYAALRPSDFDPAIRSSLLEGLDSLAKVRTGYIKRLPCVAAGGARHLVWNLAMALAMVNRRYYHFGDCRFLGELSGFPLLPGGFVRKCELLYAATDPQAIVGASEDLWSGAFESVKAHAAAPVRFSSLADLP
jgi:hypothetical protein